MFGVQIKKFNLSIHSNLFKPLPEQLIFPILRHCGFNQFDITEDYLNNLINYRGKRFGIVNFTDLSSYHTEPFNLSLITKLIDDLFILNKYVDNILTYEANINSLFCSPHYFMTNEFSFEKYLNNHWSTLQNLLFTINCPLCIIDLPFLEIPTDQIESNLTYYHKFLSKLKSKIIKLSKEARRNEVNLFLNMNISHYFHNDCQNHSIFRDFKEFRTFFEKIIEEHDNIGLYIDISSYFLFESNKISAKLIANQEIDLPLEDIKTFDNFLVRNPKLAENIFEPLCKIEGLNKIGVSDVQWLDAFKLFYQSKVNILKEGEIGLQKAYQNLINRFRFKTLPGYGTLPIKSFLLYIRQLNGSGKIPHDYSYDIPLNVEKADLNNIDWRNLDINKIEFDNQIKESIITYIRQLKSIDQPDLNLIKNMKIFSPIEIFKSIKEIYLYL